MSAGKYNIEVEKKATFSKTLQLFSTYISAGNVDNVPLNLTGATITAAIKRSINDAAIKIAFTCTIVDAALGKFNISLSAAQTAALDIDKGVWDVRIVFPSGAAERPVEGTVAVSKGVA